jgi:carbamoyltransferase
MNGVDSCNRRITVLDGDPSAAHNFANGEQSFARSQEQKQKAGRSWGKLSHSLMNILGINAYHANASAAIVCDGQLIAAVEEERFNRIKYAAGFPVEATRSCLKQAGITLAEVDHVAVPRNPYARLGTKLFYAFRMPSFARERARVLVKFGGILEALAQAFETDAKSISATFHRIEHHQAHLASSFYCSPFEDAALLSADGLGDFASTMWGEGAGPRMRVDGAVAFPHSLGLFYSAVTQYLGFLKFGDEYKVMGLGAYGQPAQIEALREVVHFSEKTLRNGFRLELDYFLHHRRGPEMSWADSGKTPVLGRLYSEEMVRKLGPARDPASAVEPRHKNLAASLQLRLEEVYLGMLSKLGARTKSRNVCLAGGVAFNCVANGKICDSTPFEQVYVQPAAGDAGLAVGAAFYVWHQKLGKPRSFVMEHAYWGPGYSTEEIWRAIDSSGIVQRGFRVAQLPEESKGQELFQRAARIIADGQILGWFQGRAEWGPRALGNRSIVADPRRPEMKDILNNRIKHREIFRPFAPSILAEATGEYFERSQPSPFMTLAYNVRPEKREVIPAPTHVDGTGRLQTVTREANPRYHALISAFRDLTGVPVVLNTSFNDNEPIVCRAEEALNCFLRTKMDALVLGDFLIQRM